MKISSATPVLFVDRVEPTRDFFLKAGFEVMFDVPEGDHLGFVGLHQGEAQVMVETRGIAALKGAKVVAERHTTFYKADELTYEEPGGNLVTFAKFDR
jgi:hypothetical protein